MSPELNPEHSEVASKAKEFIMRHIARTGIPQLVFRATEQLDKKEEEDENNNSH